VAPGRTWTGSFERALFVVFGLIVVNDVVVSMAWVSQAFEVAGGVGRAAIVLAVAALAGSALAILFGFLRPAVVYVTAAAVVGAQLVFAWAAPDSSALPGTWWAWQLMIPVCVLICAALPLSGRSRRSSSSSPRMPVCVLPRPADPGTGYTARSPTCHALACSLLSCL
jgi:hypothetical protein